MVKSRVSTIFQTFQRFEFNGIRFYVQKYVWVTCVLCKFAMKFPGPYFKCRILAIITKLEKNPIQGMETFIPHCSAIMQTLSYHVQVVVSVSILGRVKLSPGTPWIVMKYNITFYQDGRFNTYILVTPCCYLSVSCSYQSFNTCAIKVPV